MRMPVANAPLFEVVLQEVTPVVHRLSGLDLEVHPLREFVDLVEDLLEFLAAEQVGYLPAAHGNEEKHVPHDDGQLLEESAQVVKIVGVMAADGGMDLDGNARLIGPLDGLDGSRPGAGKAPESIVNLRRRAIQRDAQPDKASFF